MNNKTGISWTEKTWNPTIGCTKVSQGCKNCYAERMAYDLKAKGSKIYADGFKVKLMPSRLSEPKAISKPSLIFVNSMSDLFHDDVPDDYIKKVFAVMNACPQHTFQVLTKRPERLLALSSELNFTDNIWVGVSVENSAVLDRMDLLKQVPAKIKWLSLEPLLGPLPNLDLDGIHWVVVGGESGEKFRTMDIDWARDLRDQCVAKGIPFFFKQYSGKRPKHLGDKLDGRQWHEYPARAAQTI